jgi:hypothetical protein
MDNEEEERIQHMIAPLARAVLLLKALGAV